MSRDVDELVDRQEAIMGALAELAPKVELASVDRAGLSRAVRQLAYARGTEETCQMLDRVAAAAIAWKLRLRGQDKRSPEDIAELMADGA